MTSKTCNRQKRILKVTSNCSWCSELWRDGYGSESNEPGKDFYTLILHPLKTLHIRLLIRVIETHKGYWNILAIMFSGRMPLETSSLKEFLYLSTTVQLLLNLKCATTI